MNAQHFGENDKTVQFIHQESLEKVLRVVVASREPITIKDKAVNCETAKEVERTEFSIKMMNEPPNPPAPIESTPKTRSGQNFITSNFSGMYQSFLNRSQSIRR